MSWETFVSIAAGDRWITATWPESGYLVVVQVLAYKGSLTWVKVQPLESLENVNVHNLLY